jgi:hypothetical protein
MYERGDGGFARGRSAPAPRPGESSRPPPTAAELADEAAVALARQLVGVDLALQALRAAHTANDPERWLEARGQLAERLSETRRGADRARAGARAGDPKTMARVDAAAQRLVSCHRGSDGFTQLS